MNHVELYAKYNANQFRQSEKAIEEFKDQLVWSEKEKILDVGCGPGNSAANILAPLIPKSANLVGIDISEDMIKFANKNFGNGRLSFRTLDITTDDLTPVFGNETFDKVFSFYCLHWVQDQRKAIENIWKLMKPNGVCLITLVSHSPIFDMYKWMSEQPKWKDYMKDVDKFISPYHNIKKSSEIFKNLLNSVGFEVIKCYEKLWFLKALNLQDHRNCLQAINPFLKRIPSNEQQEFMDFIMEMLVKEEYIKDESSYNTNDEEKNENIYITPNTEILAFFRKPLTT